MKKGNKKVVFKPYVQNQLSLLPPDLGSMIGTHHPVRVVSRVIDQIDISPLLESYKGGGSSSYHPKMMLKVLIYGYLRNIYSSRKLEEALKENIHFMWLSGMARPDHSTINDFRSKRLQHVIKDIFTQVVLLLVEEGLVDIKTLYTDGTKLEANANRYSFVWAKAIATNKAKIKSRLAALWAYVEQVYKEEKQRPTKPDFEEISAQSVTNTIDQINAALSGKEIDKKVKKKLKYASDNYPSKLKEYEAKEAILGERNSYSKTDHDATFMRTKDDHMKNGQLKPCYNIQLSTNNQIVVHYTTGQHSTDTVLYKAHLDSYQNAYGFMPDVAVADAGYGSEENYDYLANQEIEAYVKYSYFHKEQKRNYKHNIRYKDNLYYSEKGDCYYCPMGQKMEKQYTKNVTTKTGFKQEVDVYQAKNCAGCPLRGRCHDSKYNRKVYRNAKLEAHKAKARELLQSKKGLDHRGQRCVDVEGTFAELKHNKGFRRFSLRGLDKVNTELGILATSMNIAKLARFMGEVCPDRSKNPKMEQSKASKGENRA